MKTDYVTWGAVLVAFVVLFWTVNMGFNSMHERFDRMNTQVNTSLNALNGRVSTIEGRLDEQREINSSPRRNKTAELPSSTSTALQ